ncbi:hypothetical protein DLE60_28005 [Micromonospora globispora]|uniref:hypothetical protein n=1 Tax=Micromonospora globispora TaxID=1450148 RepID=UPI000D6F8310|nr:hypothetical protein [Micromonospora globispora]PWU55448.1 hypothetical protein DLE60_28005 [Micromonospora globispora]RQW91847.1 hypothetical protein DKL51_20375 [Micromonospora globispora]
MYAAVDYTQATAQGLLQGGVALICGSFDHLYTAQVGDTAPVDGSISEFNGTWAEADPNGSTANSPYTYSTTHYIEGRMLSGVQRTVSPAKPARRATSRATWRVCCGGWPRRVSWRSRHLACYEVELEHILPCEISKQAIVLGRRRP